MRQRLDNKRQQLLSSEANLVEIDLLRRGARLPVIGSLPPADYYAIVSREDRRPTAEIYAWTLRQRLPAIPIPLAGDDPDVLLDLQAIFNTRYDRAGYAYSLDYRLPIEPPLSETDAGWARELLEAAAPSGR